jgi:hypothetical protein
MRWTAGGALTMLAACSQAAEAPRPDAGNAIECALSGATAFTPDCWAERAGTAALPALIVRHPDGGFRRFDVSGDDRGLAAADGADDVRVSRMNGGLEVSVGGDRYRFPASILGHADE